MSGSTSGGSNLISMKRRSVPHSAYRRPSHKAGKNAGAIQFRVENNGKYQALYGRCRSVPYKIPQLNQSHTGQELALLLSCPPFLPPDYSPKTRWSSLAQNAFPQNPGQFCRENGCPDGRCQIDKSAPITQPSDLSLRRGSMTLRHCFSEDIFIGTDAATPRIPSSVGESSFRDWPQPLNCSQSWPRQMPRPCNTSPKHPSI
jgi:hypothetical protein